MKITVSLTNVPLSEALRYVAGLAGRELRAEPHALVLQRADGNAGLESKPTAAPSTATAKEMPSSHATAALFTREWKIPAEQLRRALGTDASNEALKAALIERRVAFPEGSALAWLPEKQRLVLRNTEDNLQRLETLIQKTAGR